MNTQQDIFGGLPQPKTNTEEILLTLINTGSVSIMEFPWLSGFRTRVSELNRVGLKLVPERKKKVNKFGNTFTYVIHRLPIEEVEKAKELYLKLPF